MLEEVRRLSFSDPRKLFRKDSTPIPITELDDDTAAMISAIEVDADGRLTRIRLWDKNAALEKRPSRYSDGNGLYLYVGKTGGRSWAFLYIRAGKARELGLGAINNVSIADARAEAAKLRG